MSDPVSWLVIEPGWRVLAADGEELGRVVELIGDTGRDIFDGLSVSTGLLKKPLYVPAEHVAEITDGCVRLTLGRAEAGQLEKYEPPPPGAEIRPG